MSPRSRTLTAAGAGLREYARTPVLLALLLVLPVYAIVVFTRVVPADVVPLSLPGVGARQVDLSHVVAVLMTPLVGALTGGIAGLFLMRAARDVDGRLVVAGYRPRQVVFARFGLLLAAALAVTAVSVGVAATSYVPASPGWFALATVLAALTYGLVGVLAGVVLSRLAGVYLLMFAPMVDMFLAQSPFAEEAPAVAAYLPGHFAMELAFDAGFTASVDSEPLAGGVAYLALLATVTLAAYYRTIRVG